MGEIQENYTKLLTELRTALPDATLFLIGYPNPYAGVPAHPFSGLAGPAVQGLNQIIAGLATGFDAKFVDPYPLLVGREVELSLITRDDPANQMHLNDAGYAVVAGELIRTADTPEPSSLLLLAAGVVGAAGYRRLARGRAAA